MKNLFEIQNEILEILNNEELTEEEFQEQIQSLKGETYEKFDNIGKYIKNLEGDAELFEKMEKEFKDKKTKAQNKIKSLKKLSSNFMNSIGKDKIKTDLFSFSFRKSQSINIIDEDKIGENYSEIVETRKIDKTAIKNAIKEGKKVEGAELIENKNLQFK